MNKKTLIIFLSFSLCLLLSGCGGSTNNDTSDDTVNSDTQNIVQYTIEDCKNAVADYMTDQKSATIDSSKTVANSNNVNVDYIGRLADGTVFDTSIESIAKKCNLYTPQRDYKQGLSFVVGQQQMIEGFDKGVVGMNLGETKTITIPAEKAYGGSTITLPIGQLPTKPDGSSYQKGEKLQAMDGEIEILDINTKEFTIKNVHPLAGKDLIFDITIKNIQ